MNSSVEEKMEELFGMDDSGYEGTESFHEQDGESAAECELKPERVTQRAYINTVGLGESEVAKTHKEDEELEVEKAIRRSLQPPEERSLLAFPTSVKSPPPPAAVAAGLAQVIELGKGTSGRCGACRGCQRDACGACSLCKRGAFEGCIDKYCSEEETGRLQRAHMKELYLKFLQRSPKKEEDEVCHKCNSNAIEEAQDNYESVKREITDIKDGVKLTASGQVRKVHNIRYAYGSGKNSKKARRCGECEGCTRERMCYKCAVCVKGVEQMKISKQICLERKCHMRGVLRRMGSV